MRGGPPAVSESEVKSGRAPCPTERATAAVAHDIEGQAPPSGGYAALDLPAAESSTAMPDTGVAILFAAKTRRASALLPTRCRRDQSGARSSEIAPGRAKSLPWPARGASPTRCAVPVSALNASHQMPWAETVSYTHLRA